MKYRLIRFRMLIVAAMLAAVGLPSGAQIYDGITQPDRFRIWGAVSQPYKGGEASASTYFGYRQDVCPWFDVTALARYNFSSRAFMPAIWLNFNIGKRYYLLTRSIYNFKEERYVQSLAATVKLPAGFMVDATWDELYNGRRWCSGDRLQAVAGMNLSRIRTIFNVGYSFRSRKGAVGTIRYRFNDSLWVQLRGDGGTETVDFSMAYNFN